MDATDDVNGEQAALWNGPAGRAWVEAQSVLDTMFEPFEALLEEAVVQAAASRVLDVGCGTGSTTRAIARRLGAQADCLGLDISEPMIATARERAQREGSPARFITADAQRHAFEPASFDTVVSRFGVMFFGDFVQAFANLRRATRRGGALCFIAWRGADENPFMTTAERAAAPLLPGLPARRPDGPGQFAFADKGRIAGILNDSGWADIDIQPIDVACTLPERELLRYLSWMGPVGALLQQADAATRRTIVPTVRAAFEPFVHGGDVRFTAACWIVTSSNPGTAPP